MKRKREVAQARYIGEVEKDKEEKEEIQDEGGNIGGQGEEVRGDKMKEVT